MHRLSYSIEQLLRLLILAGFAFLFHKVISSGHLLQLIHPQFTLNAKLGWGLFILLAVAQTLRLFSHPHTQTGCCHNHQFAGCFYYVFIGTLAVFLLIPAKPLGAITAEQKGMKYLDSGYSTPASTLPDRNPPASGSGPGQPALLINDDNHIRLITAMYEDTARFIGREINLKGFVYRPNQLKPNQFMVVRFEISCCAADGMPSGLLVEWPDSHLFKNDTWMEVQGKIQQGNYEGIAVPLLIATKAVSIAPLASPYVYTGTFVINPEHLQNAH